MITRLKYWLLTRLWKALKGVQASSAPAPAAGGEVDRPYEAMLNDAARDGRVLRREHIYGSGPPNMEPNPTVLAILLRWAGSSVLDVGCGIGAYTAAAAARGIRAEGIELDERYVAAARELGRPVRAYDGAHIPFPDRAFECAAAIEVLEHVPEWEQLLREMTRVADRTVLISVPNIGVLPALARHLVGPWHLLEATHVNFFTTGILQTYLSKNYPEWRCEVSEYGQFSVNGDVVANHVLAVMQRENT
jgi:SAM-dependent methyltransferase